MNSLAEKVELRDPKTNKDEIILTLIMAGKVSIMDFPYLSGFRTRVSEIRDLFMKKGLPLHTSMNTGINKFKRTYLYAVHQIDLKNIQEIIKIYNDEK